MLSSPQDDRIHPFTRIITGLVVPFLLLAFLVLYLTPGQSGVRFAWAIQPNMTAMFMGAGYLGGAWLLANAALGRRWHRVAAGFPAVAAFTVAMLAATLMHSDRFDLSHFPALLWLVLYVITPFLVPTVWLLNRPTDGGDPELHDLEVPRAARLGLMVLGALLLVSAVVGFLQPALLAQVWPWALSPLTARILSGWFALLGVGGFVISREWRWSGWVVGLQSIGLWHVLVLVAAVVRREDFPGGLANWYLASVVLVLFGMAGLAIVMARQSWLDRRHNATPSL